MKKIVFHFLLMCFFISCSQQLSKERQNYLALLSVGKYQEAREYIEKSKYYNLPQNNLLKNLELGGISFHQMKFLDAIDFFNKAQKISEDQYTVLLSKKLSSISVGRDKDVFYAQNFERSYLYFMQSASYYKAYEETKDRKYLFSARASVVAWNNFFKTLNQEKKVRSLYLDDFFSKIYASHIHEQVGGSSELAIAYQLLLDGLKILKILGPQYSDYNSNHQQYAESLIKAISESKEVTEQFRRQDVIWTEEAKRVEMLFLMKLQNIGKKINRKDHLKFFKVSAEKGFIDQPVSLMVISDFIPEKKAKKIDLSLKAAFNQQNGPVQPFLSVVGYLAFSNFAYKILGLKSSGNSYTFEQAYNLNQLVQLGAQEAALDFEIPVQNNIYPRSALIFENEKNISIGDRHLFEKPILVSPVDSIAQRSTEEQSVENLLSSGLTFVIKHALAMTGSYSLYQSLNKNKDQDFFARTAAMAAYFSAAKLISISEQADTRFWASLPRTIWISLHNRLDDSKKVRFTQGHQAVKIIDMDSSTLVNNSFILVNGN